MLNGQWFYEAFNLNFFHGDENAVVMLTDSIVSVEDYVFVRRSYFQRVFVSRPPMSSRSMFRHSLVDALSC